MKNKLLALIVLSFFSLSCDQHNWSETKKLHHNHSQEKKSNHTKKNYDATKVNNKKDTHLHHH